MKSFIKLTNMSKLRLIDGHSEGALFEGCKFGDITIGSLTSSLEGRVTFEGVTLQKVKVGIVTMYAPILKSILVDNVSTRVHAHICGALFEQCVFKGRVGSLMLIEGVDRSKRASDGVNLEVINENAAAYDEMNWALDISGADFTEFDCRSIPAEKILINNESQIAVNYQKLKEITAHPDDEMSIMAEVLLGGRPSQYNFVLTTSKRTKRYESEVRLFNYLQDQGCQLK